MGASRTAASVSLLLRDGETAERRPWREGVALDPMRLARALARGWRWLVAAVVVGSITAGLALVYLLPPTYVAYAALICEEAPEVEGLPRRPAPNMRSIAASVLPTTLPEVRRGIGNAESSAELERRVEVRYGRGSRILILRGQGETTEEARELTNAVVDAFIDRRRQEEQEWGERHLAVIREDGLRAARALEEAQRRYDAFRREHDIADVGAEQELARGAVGELRAAADQARVDATGAAGRLGQFSEAAERRRASPAISSHRTVSVAPELAAARRELAATAGGLSHDHPRVQALRARVDALQASAAHSPVVSREVMVDPGIASLDEDATASDAEEAASRGREAELDSLTEEAGARLQRLAQLESRAAPLRSAVEREREHLDELEALELRVVDAARSPATGLQVASRAEVSGGARAARQRWRAAASIPLSALLLVVGFLFSRELRFLRVTTPTEIAYWGGGPVVGSTSWPANERALTLLAAELDDYLPDAHGVTLVLGATRVERGLAGDLAAELNGGTRASTGGAPLDDEEELGGEPGREIVHVGAEAGAWQGGGGDEERGSAEGRTRAVAWRGGERGPELRRALRVADRVLVVAPSGELSMPLLWRLRRRLRGRTPVGFVVVGLPQRLGDVADRVGDVETFWSAVRGGSSDEEASAPGPRRAPPAR